MKSKDFRIILFTQIVGILCSGLLNFAMALHVLDLTGSATIFSTIVSISFIPTIIVGPIGGILADRLPKKKLLMIADTVKACLVIVLATALFLGIETIVLIGVILTVMITFTTVYLPIVAAIVPSIVDKEDLVKANSLVQSVKSLSRFAAPAVGGILFGLVGIYQLVIGVAVLYIISAMTNFFLRLPENEKGFEGGIFKAIKDDLGVGFTYILKTDPRIFELALTVGLIAMAFFSILTVALPFIGRVVLEVTEFQFGIAQAVTGTAALFGAIFAGQKQVRRFLQPKYVNHWTFVSVLVSIPISLSMLPTLGLPNIGRFVLFTVGLFFTMATFTIFNIIKMAAIQKNAPADMVGKATAITMSITVIPIPIMQRLMGEVLDLVGGNFSGLAMIFFALTFFVFCVGVVKVFWGRRRSCEGESVI
ncbi:MAG: MFS transporter [Turicibacter sp.]|nr:MFS transporter [Turicibacter sp.]